MKRILYLLILLTSTSFLKAQTAEDSVKACINQFFEGMKNVDVNAITSAFADSAILQTVVNRGGKISIRNEPLAGFADVIKQQKKGDLNERIQFETIKI